MCESRSKNFYFHAQCEKCRRNGAHSLEHTQYSFASLSPDVRSIYTVLAVDHILYAVLAIEHILYAVLAAHIYANLPHE